MSDSYFAEETFKGSKKIETGYYENCRFLNCILQNFDLSGINFIECEFENCDFSSARLFDTSFKDVIFKSSKLLGLRFEDCNEFLFSIEFHSCNLNLSSFYRMSPKKIAFYDCNLKEVDFTEADLSETMFDTCNLDQAVFKNTNLQKADFKTSTNFLIDPEINSITKAKFSIQSLPGLLYKYELNIE